MLRKLVLRLLTLLVILSCPIKTTGSTQSALIPIFQKMEAIARNLADLAESNFAQRCALASLDCTAQSYRGCQSKFPNATCDQRYASSRCSNNGLRIDHQQSSVWLASGIQNNLGTTVIDQICYTLSFDPEWNRIAKSNSELDSQFMGTYNGVMRIHPALLLENCGSYDPRFRPWYVAASSGPKDVVIVLDVSGSMSTSRRMDLAKEAAQTVLSTLTIADFVQVISFNSNARTLDGSSLLSPATADNLQRFTTSVGSLTPNGPTNFEAAFGSAFDVLDASASQERTSNCHKAILFLTDGIPTAGQTDKTILSNMILQRNAQHKAFIFTYSLGSGAETSLLKSVACATKGLWQDVPDQGDLRSQMGLFYDVFATGMSGVVGNSTSVNVSDRFTAWVEPYVYASGGGTGTTVASPVYDRQTSPPTLIGVTGADLTTADMTRIEPNALRLLEALTLRASRCPRLDLSECQLESIRARYATSTSNTTCGTCSNFTSTHPQPCASNQYPAASQLWANLDNLPWQDRACCQTSGALLTGSQGTTLVFFWAIPTGIGAVLILFCGSLGSL